MKKSIVVINEETYRAPQKPTVPYIGTEVTINNIHPIMRPLYEDCQRMISRSEFYDLKEDLFKKFDIKKAEYTDLADRVCISIFYSFLLIYESFEKKSNKKAMEFFDNQKYIIPDNEKNFTYFIFKNVISQYRNDLGFPMIGCYYYNLYLYIFLKSQQKSFSNTSLYNYFLQEFINAYIPLHPDSKKNPIKKISTIIDKWKKLIPGTIEFEDFKKEVINIINFCTKETEVREINKKQSIIIHNLLSVEEGIEKLKDLIIEFSQNFDKKAYIKTATASDIKDRQTELMCKEYDIDESKSINLLNNGELPIYDFIESWFVRSIKFLERVTKMGLTEKKKSNSEKVEVNHIKELFVNSNWIEYLDLLTKTKPQLLLKIGEEKWEVVNVKGNKADIISYFNELKDTKVMKWIEDKKLVNLLSKIGILITYATFNNNTQRRLFSWEKFKVNPVTTK